MNNSSTSVSVSTGLNDILALNKKSLQSLSANIPASSLLTIFGFVSATGNILTIITITMNKNLHTKCYFLMANLSVTDFLVGGSYFVTGIKRLVRAVWSIPETNSQLKCLLEMFIPFLSQIASINFAAAICVDRLFAVSKPNTYRLAHSYYTIFLTGLAWGYSLCLGGFYFYQSSNDVMLATCTLVGIMEESFYNYQNAQSTVLAVFTSVSYIAVLITMRFKLKVANKEQRLAQNKGNLERQITLTLSAVMFAYLVTQLASTIGLTAIEGLETQTRNTLGPLFRVLPVISSGIDFWIYLWRSNEFRSGFVSTFCFTKKTKVGSQIQSTITRSHLNN